MSTPQTPPRPRRFDFSLTRQILALTIPIALTRQLDNIVGTADIFMVSHLGPAAISAVGISRTIVMVISVTMIAVTTGTFTIVAQAIGANDPMRASSAAKQSFTLLSGLSVFLSAIGILSAPYLLRALSLAPDVVNEATPYLRVFFSGSVLMTLNFAVTTCLQAAGDTRTPFYIGILNNTCKVASGFMLIFGVWGLPEMGVVGAAIGGLIGRGVGVIAGMMVLYSGRFGITLLPGTTFRPNIELTRRILKIGIPSALQGLFRNGSGVVFVKLVAMTSASTTAVAAFAIGNQMERFVRQVSLSFGTAATTIVGQGLGANKPEEAESRGWTALTLSVIIVAILGIPLAFFATPIMHAFTNAPDVIQTGTIYLYAIALAEPFMCAALVSGGALRGAGDTMPALYYTLISQWLIRLPGAAFLAFYMGYDINGIWASLVIFSALQGFLTVRKFAQGEWKTREI